MAFTLIYRPGGVECPFPVTIKNTWRRSIPSAEVHFDMLETEIIEFIAIFVGNYK